MLLHIDPTRSEGNVRIPGSRFGLVYDLLCCRGNSHAPGQGKKTTTATSRRR